MPFNVRDTLFLSFDLSRATNFNTVPVTLNSLTFVLYLLISNMVSRSSNRLLLFVTVPRYYHIHQHTPITLQIHGFSDASEKAYAAVVYLRTVYSNGMVSTCILTSKTRVAPMKKQTTPRLELLGATILSRLVHNIQKVLRTYTTPSVLLDRLLDSVMLDQKSSSVETVCIDPSRRNSQVGR